MIDADSTREDKEMFLREAALRGHEVIASWLVEIAEVDLGGKDAMDGTTEIVPHTPVSIFSRAKSQGVIYLLLTPKIVSKDGGSQLPSLPKELWMILDPLKLFEMPNEAHYININLHRKEAYSPVNVRELSESVIFKPKIL